MEQNKVRTREMKNVEQQSIGLIEALHSTPARRYLSDSPIDDEILWEILDAAIRGPSGGNSQGWAWLVVKDQAVKNQISELLEHRKLYREMKDNSKSKKDRECARLCLRTINDSLASFRKMVY